LCTEKCDDLRHSIAAAAAQNNLKEKPKMLNKFTNNRFLSDEQRNDKFFQQGVEKGRKEGIKLAAEKAQNIPNESPLVKSAIKLVQVLEHEKNSHLNAKINILSDCINNAASQAKNGNGNGNRFSEDSKVFSSIMRLNGGSRMSNLFSYNLGGPAASTTKKYMKDHGYNFQCGEISMSNLEKIISIWNSIIEKKVLLFDERDDILIMCQQDCTGINPAAIYDSSSNKVLGAIFKGGDSNRNFEVMAELPQTFTDIQMYLESLELVSYSMLTMLVPLHEDLPALPWLIHPTNNRYNKEDLHKLWSQIANFLDINLQNLSKKRKIKYIGIGTDGDSRAYSVMKMELEKRRTIYIFICTFFIYF
jgi:hypothetical protein